MKKVIFSVEETRKANYTIEIDVKNKDAKAFEDGEISEEELKDMYEDEIEKATAEGPEDYDIEDRWIEFEDMED